MRAPGVKASGAPWKGLFAACKRVLYDLYVSTTSTLPETPANGSQSPPDGYHWVLVPETRSPGARSTRTYAWRVYEDEEVLIEALAETFASKKASEALRWVFAQPTVRQAMFDRIRGTK